MFRHVKLGIATLVRLFRSRQGLLLENLALRQQLAVLKRRTPRPSLGNFDRLFWVVARRLWSGWRRSLILVTPETVVRRHRAGFRLYWKWVSRASGPIGRRPASQEVRDLIFRMVADNPIWGAPRIHGELLMLGFEVSERTVFRWMKRAPRNPEPAKRWLAFPSFIILVDAYSQVIPRNSALDSAFACCSGTGDLVAPPPNRRASEVRRKNFRN